MSVPPSDFPVPDNEFERVSALQDLWILDTPPSPGFDRLCELARDLFDVPMALVSLVDARRQWFKARSGVDVDCTDRGSAFCAHTIMSEDLLVVPDTTRDERFAHSPLVTQPSGIRFYAGAPLWITPGLRVGSFCILDTRPRDFSDAQRRILRRLGDVVVDELRRHQTQDQNRRYERQRSLAESITQAGSWERDLETDRTLWSDGMFQVFDLDRATTKPGFEAGLARVHPEDREALIRAVRRARTEHEPFHMHFRVVRRSGEERWLETSAYVLRGEGGRAARLVGTLNDVTERRQAQAELASREERYRALTEASSNIFWRADTSGGMAEAWGWSEFTGQSADDAMGQGWIKFVHPADLADVIDRVAKALESGGTFESEYRLRTAAGDYHWVLARGVPLRDRQGGIVEWVGTTTDIHERRQNADTLYRSEQRLKLALTAGGMVAWDLDPTTGAFVHSGNAKAVYGLDSSHYYPFLERIHPDDVEIIRKALDNVPVGEMVQAECRFMKPDGSLAWLEFRCVRASLESRRVVGVTFDVTERKKALDEIWRAANHDPLTGLPNRGFFGTRFEAALAGAARSGSWAALFVIDIDDFKGINDTLGHDAGDTLLREMSKRLRSVLRESDLVARLGGDEFAVLVLQLPDREEAIRLCRRILHQLGRAYDHNGRTVVSRASAGIAFYPDHDLTPAELMKDADMALYAAKSQGANRAAVYSPDMRRAMDNRMRVAGEIRGALKRGEIVPYYQPKICLATGAIQGFEALARWRHPDRGLLTPAAFATVFEDRELSTLVGQCMVRQVVADLQAWRSHDIDCTRIAVNVSASELADDGLADRMLGMLAEAGIPSSMLEIEVTEGVFLGAGSERVEAELQQFHRAGVTIALDDFGTGYASLIHLKKFPISRIKIDRSFILNVTDDKDDAAIVSAVITLGKSLGMKLIAEGVETHAQMRVLADCGCDYGQGYLFARPMPGDRVASFIAGWSSDCVDEAEQRSVA